MSITLGPSLGFPFVMFQLSVREPVTHFRKGKVVVEHKGLPAETPETPHDVPSCTVTLARPISVVVPST